MKKEFFEPEVEVLLFDIEDIVTTSNGTVGGFGEGGNTGSQGDEDDELE